MKKDILYTKDKDKEFHKSRKMFFIIDDKILIAHFGVEQSHFEWLKEKGIVDESTADEFFEKMIRGHYIDNLNTIYFYTGMGFSFNEETILRVKSLLKDLEIKLGLNLETRICFGPKDKVINGVEWPQLCIGTLKQVEESM